MKIRKLPTLSIFEGLLIIHIFDFITLFICISWYDHEIFLLWPVNITDYVAAAAAAAKSRQSCPTLCDPIDGYRGLKNLKKIFLIKKIMVKIYLGLSLVLLWTVWGQFIFR